MTPTRKPDFRRFGLSTTTRSGTSHAPTGRDLAVDNSSAKQTTTPASKSYDETGAMQFIVCTIIVYSVGGVCCTFVSRFRKYTRSNSDFKAQDEAVNKYLKKERKLKHEGYKMQMLNEIKKHSESIKRYEERMRLLELERELQMEDFGSACAKNNKSKRKGFLKRNKKKQNLVNKTNPGVLPPRLSSRRKSASDALGKVGFSLLFMEPANPRLRELQEEDEEVDSAPESASKDLSLSCSNIEIPVQLPVVELEQENVEENSNTEEQTGEMNKHLLAVEETTLSSSV